MRKYLRHPTNIPIEYKITGDAQRKKDVSKNISIGGICFQSKFCIDEGVTLSLTIPTITPDFCVQGNVVWCLKHKNHADIGVEFLDPDDSNRTRIVEQICYIKQYKKDIFEQEGRNLSDEQAAVEWIRKYAKQFPV
jgi:hypothetical protein